MITAVSTDCPREKCHQIQWRYVVLVRVLTCTILHHFDSNKHRNQNDTKLRNRAYHILHEIIFYCNLYP